MPPASAEPSGRDRLDPEVTRRAADVLDRYRQLHARILDPADTSVPKEFVVLPEHAWHGLGNSQLTYAYAFLVALLSGRALIGLPFPGADRCFRLPFRAGLDGVRGAIGLDLRAVPAYAELVARRTYPGWAPAEWLACRDYGRFPDDQYLSLAEGRVQVYRVDRGIPHVVFATLNPHHRHALRERFGRHVLLHVLRFLFPPSPAVEQDVQACRARLGDGFVLGVQLRYGHGWRDLYCRDRGALRRFWDCAEAVLASRGGGSPRLFLATDTEAIRADARGRFGDRVVTLDVPVVPDGEPFWAAVDQRVLMTCDALVVTNRSTFGYVAHAAAGVVPWIVDGKLGTVTRPADSQAGLYKDSRWEVESIWPWQRRALARCSCDARSRGSDQAGGRGRASPRDVLRWLVFIEAAGRVQRTRTRLTRLARRLPPPIQEAIRRGLGRGVSTRS